ncbi:MAG: hypothetical protein WCV99_09035 [Sterolibacterium sp.]
MKTAQIGKCGELLVQYQLLLRGVESAHLTTDSGVDLVAYSPRNARPITIQVKTNLKAKAAGGKGKEGLDWWVPEDSPAHYFAFVDLSSQRIWMLSKTEVSALAQQTSNSRHHLYMYIDPTVKPIKTGRPVHSYEFEKYLLQNRAHDVFDV